MSRTFRRATPGDFQQKLLLIREFPLKENEGFIRGRNLNQVLHRWFGDNGPSLFGPNKTWKRLSHKIYRAYQQGELGKLKYMGEDQIEDYSFPETFAGNGLDMWDWD